MHRRAPEAEQRRVDPRPQHVEHVLDPGLAVGREPPQVRPADHHRAGAERECLDHVAAAAHAAEQGLIIDYRVSTAEQLLAAGEAPFDSPSVIASVCPSRTATRVHVAEMGAAQGVMPDPE